MASVRDQNARNNIIPSASTSHSRTYRPRVVSRPDLSLKRDAKEVAPMDATQVVCAKCHWRCARPSRRRGLLDGIAVLLILRPYRCRSCGGRHYRLSDGVAYQLRRFLDSCLVIAPRGVRYHLGKWPASNLDIRPVRNRVPSVLRLR